MPSRRFASLLILGSLGMSPASAADMTLEFSWRGVEACRGGGVSPALQVKNAPRGTRTFFFTLERILGRETRELGGSSVPFRADGQIPPGSVYTNAPCEPADYRWTVKALDATGRTIATASKAEFFAGR
ncbi:MAG: hypothetical protein ABW003_29480 [Microvirga sp.]